MREKNVRHISRRRETKARRMEIAAEASEAASAATAATKHHK